MAKIVSVSYYEYLVDEIIKNLDIINSRAEVLNEKFNDGEICITFKESLRGEHLFIIGETSKNLTETLLIIDAAKRNAVKEVTLILPYYGYSRQDKKEENRKCIGAKMIAHVLESMNINRLVTIDLHAEQIQGFFDSTVEHITGRTIFLQNISKIVQNENYLLVSPDEGGYKRVGKFAKALKIPMVSINKVRDKPGSIESMELMGNVIDKKVIVIDDIFDTGNTLLKSNELLLEKGAKEVCNFITHMVLSKPEILFKFAEKGIKIYTTDTLNTVLKFLNKLPVIERELLQKHVKVFKTAPILANAIIQIMNYGSIMSLNEIETTII